MNYDLLIQKLDVFIRKYYFNKLLRGILLFVGLVIGIYLLISISEYQFYFSTLVRKILLSFFTITAILTSIFWVIIPLLQIIKLGSTINYEQAADIIGKHFSDVADKLLNILQLKDTTDKVKNNELLEASIQQKIDQIRLVPFTNAVDLNQNKKLLKYTLPPLLVLVFLVFAAPNVLKESNIRLANPNKKFAKKAPFDFYVDLPKKKIIQYQDIKIEAYTKGKILPSEVVLIYDNNEYKLSKNKENKFEHSFINVQEDIKFQLRASEFYSEEYIIKVYKKPIITQFTLLANYPAYTGKKNNLLKNTGDLTVPEGTILQWQFNTTNADNIVMYNGTEKSIASLNSKNQFNISKKILSDFKYTITVEKNGIETNDSLYFMITTIPDRSPAISVEQITDSSNSRYRYFLGTLSDDYGLNNLYFHYRISTENGAIREAKKIIVPIKNTTVTDFSYNYDLQKNTLKPGEKIDYFFEVWDNDAIHGSKAARSNTFTYLKPTIEQYEEIIEQNSEAIKDDLSNAQKQVKKLSEEIKNLKNKLASKKSLDWEDKKQIDQLKDKHQQLSKELEEVKNKMQDAQNNEKEIKKIDEEILAKQEKLEQMMDELLSDEIKDMLKQLEDMLQKMQQNNAFERLDNMQMSNENANKELDKMLELYKQLELEKKVKDNIEKLEKLAEKQEKLSEDSKDTKQKSEDLLPKQEQLNKDFDQLKEEMKKMEELNKESKSPMEFSEEQEAQEEIEQEMDNSSDNLQENKKNDASKSQKSAADKMKKSAKSLSAKLDKMAEDKNAEDIESIRRLLENLIRLSMDQENLFTTLKKTSTDNPKYIKLIQEQYKLKDDAQLIEDSLTALGKRQFEIQSIITDEIYKIRRDMKKSITDLEARQRNTALVAQQYIMTSANNLALLLSESMDKMQQQQNSGSPGSGSCNKPGGKGSGKPSMAKLKQMQQQLGNDLKKLGEQIKNGGDPKKMGKDFAQMAERQAALREALRQMKDEMSQQQKDKSGINDLMDKMDKTETDLVNRKVTSETLKRQKEIETRMLELDEALRQQGQDDERKSNSAQDLPANKIPQQIQEYLKNKEAQDDFYKSLPPDLKPFYKNLVERYYELSK
jgi:hypothetical protein